MSLSDEDRRKLDRLAQVMLPGSVGMSGASELQLAHAPVDRVLRIEPALAPKLAHFLTRAGFVGSLGDVEALAQEDPEEFKALEVVLANAYFMHDTVRGEIGYPGQEARDSSVGLDDRDLALLEPVRARGAIWRE